MYDYLIKWIHDNLLLQNDLSYRLDKTLFKKMQYKNEDIIFMDVIDLKNRYNKTYKSFIKILRQTLNKYNIKLKYTINYIYSTYDIVYYIYIN